uniref:Uncharacterized protein n=1 Tax=Rhizophagus irregularis (strain DAOM 181602 / DAOM 197198 / MUCL 43194) TaxID=747089 RepID=U9UG72_RHIID
MLSMGKKIFPIKSQLPYYNNQIFINIIPTMNKMVILSIWIFCYTIKLHNMKINIFTVFTLNYRNNIILSISELPSFINRPGLDFLHHAYPVFASLQSEICQSFQFVLSIL